ncbi:hypothetical protein NOF04DRAFT_18268 [Fusarium oxysporum II5]|uniref:Uncharacterized protein n=1 Tax=Fusarium odoratissimum (strain NRRL 54006) TaxID=1089451 RepID=X0J3Y4_FUSO5|nr:uncharacterized protein FOIG_15757 [Fusarium odoratissimum NRRL 54006]EXL91076.1 hypothetical protein FOIG_15757 [Fusarium odoratissimum NRRL 54006]KAK2123044.1 hypothetical protein NOF04DRAFT_18268 [Fusarium oxysporum II5]
MSRTHPPNSQMEVFGELARSRERSYSNMHTSTIGSGPKNNTLSNIGRLISTALKYGVSCIIKDFAIEFDQSWSINRPGNIYGLSEENSARGYLEKLLFDRAHHRNFDGLENIWLIDKGAMWSRHPHQYYCTSDVEGLQEAPTPEHEIVAVYRGCDAEYVEVAWEQCSHKTADGMAPSSKGFVEKLGLESDFVALPPSAQMRSSPKKDSATLARRLVQVGHGLLFSSFNHIQ